MARYPLNLPPDLKKVAEELAKKQGVSLNQFIRQFSDFCLYTFCYYRLGLFTN